MEKQPVSVNQDQKLQTLINQQDKSETQHAAGFDPDKSVAKYRTWVSRYGIEKADQIARQVFPADIRSLSWELSEGPLPYHYRMFLSKDEANNQFLVHESDLHDNTPLKNGLNPDIRNGLETKQMEMFEEKLIEAPVGSTVAILSPKRHERDETEQDCSYGDSITTFAYKFDDETLFCRQFMTKQSPTAMAEWLNLLSNQRLINPESHISEIMLTPAVFDREVLNEEIWQTLEKTGLELFKKPLAQIFAQEKRFDDFAQSGGEKLLSWIKNELKGEALLKRYTALMKDCMKGVTSSKIITKANGDTSFLTSCGEFGSSVMTTGINGAFGSLASFNGERIKMWCSECGVVNTCNTDRCYKADCRGKLTKRKPQRLSFAA